MRRPVQSQLQRDFIESIHTNSCLHVDCQPPPRQAFLSRPTVYMYSVQINLTGPLYGPRDM